VRGLQLTHEFGCDLQVAEVLGRQIIEELNLPPEKRTITPEQGIGEAGGTKYILVRLNANHWSLWGETMSAAVIWRWERY
jgi:hypothetical protein